MLRILVLAASLASAAPPGPADDFRYFAAERGASTALRRVAPAQGSPVAVDVITAEEISASGSERLWDLLRFRAGVDVIEGRSSAGANRAVVSVRGIPRDATNELLVLLDGRSVYSPLSGITIWQQIPVQLQDIERIEIVRGPNAALFGSNAGLGVINIITRRPSARASGQARAWGGTRSSAQGSAAAEAASLRGFGVRASATAGTEAGAPSAADPRVEGHDFLRDKKANLRSAARLGEADLDLSGGLSLQEFGKSFGSLAQGRHDSNFLMARLERPLGGASRVELRLSRDESVSEAFPESSGRRSRTRFWQYETEALHTIEWGEGRLHTTYGAAGRYSAAESAVNLGPGVIRNRTIRGFLHQSLALHPAVSIMGGVNHETADMGGYHKDFQVAALWSPVEKHSLRLSYSRANTKPQIFHEAARLDANAFVRIEGNPRLRPSPLTSYEAGWTGRLRDGELELELHGFYTQIRDHLNIEIVRTGLPTLLTWENTNTVVLRGLEAGVRWRPAAGRSLYANYTREEVRDQDAHTLYLRTTPAHKVNLGFDWPLPAGFRAAMNAGWKDYYLADSTSGSAQEPVPSFWRLDAKLSWSAASWLELFAAGQNLEQPYRREFVDGLLVPRLIRAGATVRF